MRHTFTTLLQPSSPTTPPGDVLLPDIETWATANAGLLVLTGIFATVAIPVIASDYVRKKLWLLLKSLWKLVVFVWKRSGATVKWLAGWVRDKWLRVATPLEDRNVLSAAQKEWDTERKSLQSEVSKFRGLAEKRHQEVKVVADERDKFLAQLERTNAKRSSGSSPSTPQSASITAEDGLDLEILRQTNSLGFSSNSWVLRNWGPGTAYDVYIAAVDPSAKVKQNSVKKLEPQENVVLYDGYSSLPRHLSLLETPKIRVSYKDAAGEKIVENIPFPKSLFDL